MRKGNLILMALLGLSLVWAYVLTHGGFRVPGGEGVTQVWQERETDISRVEYQGKGIRVTLTPRPDAVGGAGMVWVEAEEPAQGGTKVQRAFKGGETTQGLMAFLAAPTAVRELGRLKTLDAKQLVLPNPEYYLEVYLKEKSSPLRLEIGRDAYGDNQRYGYRPDTERVYLFPSAELDKLARNPSQMMERRLFTVNPPQMDRVEVLMAGTTQVMYRLTGRMGWNDAADAADNNTEMERFVIMLGRLSTEAYLPDEKVPPSGSPALRMEVRLFRGKESEPVEWLRLWGQLPGGARAVSSLSGLAVSLSDSVVNPLLQAQEALGKGR